MFNVDKQGCHWGGRGILPARKQPEHPIKNKQDYRSFACTEVIEVKSVITPFGR